MRRRAILILTYLAVICGITTAQRYPFFDEYLGLPGKLEIDQHRVKKFSEEDAKAYTKFWLYTKKNRAVNDAQELRTNDTSSIQRSNFNVSNPVRFLIHGFTNRKESEFNTILTKAYLDKGQFNVIVVDWGALSENMLTAIWTYETVASSVKYIGCLVGKFAIFLNKTMKVPYDNMYLAGHSLGAHIAGIAGQTVKPNLFRTIFALDPAGPHFHKLLDDEKVDASDAYYVESINTNSFGFPAFGYKGALGHAAFFANFGTEQPGCNMIACSHTRAFEYFAESIISHKPFYAKQCSSFEEIQKEECSSANRTIIMGGEPSQPKRSGIFYVHTNESSPYRVDQVDPNDFVQSRFYYSKYKNAVSTQSSTLGYSKPTRVLICDYKNSLNGTNYCKAIKDTYMKYHDVNVITIDWEKVVTKQMYKTEIFDDDIARFTARMIERANKEFKVPFNKTYIIGDGLGAQIAGLVAKELAPNKIDTLFVLDYDQPMEQISASYIESIQSSASTDNGHASVFIDYAGLSPRCAYVEQECLHLKAIEIFMETLSDPDKYMAQRCKNMTEIYEQACDTNGQTVRIGGEPSNHNRHGVYYLETEKNLMEPSRNVTN